MNLADLPDDDDDLPEAPAPQTERPRDPATQRFVKAPEKAPQPPTPEPAKPTHSPYIEFTARQLGISEADIAAMPPATLERLVARLQAPSPTSSVPAVPTPAPVEDAIDWGTGDDGQPLTEKDYLPALARAIKASHRVEKLEKENQALRGSLDRDRQERAWRQVVRQVNQVLATRPDLFGEKPGQAAPGSPEDSRYRLALAHIDQLLAQKRATTPQQDARAALDLFGPAQPAPKPARKPGAPSLAEYAAGELGKPSQRRGPDPRSYRERRIEEVAAQQRENGYFIPSADDDDDLPD